MCALRLGQCPTGSVARGRPAHVQRAKAFIESDALRPRCGHEARARQAEAVPIKLNAKLVVARAIVRACVAEGPQARDVAQRSRQALDIRGPDAVTLVELHELGEQDCRLQLAQWTDDVPAIQESS